MWSKQITNKSFAIIIPIINAASIDLNLGLRYENKTITCCESSKYLGVTIDNKLKFKAHIGYVTLKVELLDQLAF